MPSILLDLNGHSVKIIATVSFGLICGLRSAWISRCISVLNQPLGYVHSPSSEAISQIPLRAIDETPQKRGYGGNTVGVVQGIDRLLLSSQTATIHELIGVITRCHPLVSKLVESPFNRGQS